MSFSVLMNFLNFLLNCNLFNVLIDDKIKVINDSLCGIDYNTEHVAVYKIVTYFPSYYIVQ